MMISVGKKYQDERGRVIKIISDVASLPFCYIGEVLFTGELLRYSNNGTIYDSNDINLVKQLGAVALEAALEDIPASNELTLSNEAVEEIAHRVGEMATKEDLE